MKRALRWAFLTFAGLVLAQAAWILILPPFHAIDEFDHVYRAAGVSSGQWRLTQPATDGRGETVVVSAKTVAAGAAQCSSLADPGPDNCIPIERYGNGKVLIATAAGGYNPVYYWVVGSLAKPFEGAAADYAMRIASALLSALGVGFAAFCLGLQRVGPWTRLGFVVSLTPVLIYTTVIPAPNAWEIVAGLCLWASMLAVLRGQMSAMASSLLIWAATCSACLLVTPRMLGPMWLGLIVLVSALYVGAVQLRSALCRNPLSWILGSTLVIAATVASSWWTLSADLTHATANTPKTLGEVAIKPLTWTLGVVGAFPFRDQPAPLPTYGLYLTVVGVLLWAAIRYGCARERVAILVAVTITLIVPMTLTLITMHDRGTIWQGRYGLPFIVGILILAGLVLDRNDLARVERSRLFPLGLLMTGIAQVWSVMHVFEFERAGTSTIPSPQWVTMSAPLVAILMIAAWALLSTAAMTSLRNESGNEHPRKIQFSDGQEPLGGASVRQVSEMSGRGDEHG